MSTYLLDPKILYTLSLPIAITDLKENHLKINFRSQKEKSDEIYKCFFIHHFFECFLTFSFYSMEQQLIVIRHGEAGNNIEKVYNSNPENPNYKIFNLTEAGILATQKTAKDLIAQGFSNDNIAAVFVSPLPRTKQTADILVQQGLVSKNKIILDKRLIELNAEIWKENRHFLIGNLPLQRIIMPNQKNK